MPPTILPTEPAPLAAALATLPPDAAREWSRFVQQLTQRWMNRRGDGDYRRSAAWDRAVAASTAAQRVLDYVHLLPALAEQLRTLDEPPAVTDSPTLCVPLDDQGQCFYGYVGAPSQLLNLATGATWPRAAGAAAARVDSDPPWSWVGWWPRVPDALVDQGVTDWTELPADAVVLPGATPPVPCSVDVLADVWPFVPVKIRAAYADECPGPMRAAFGWLGTLTAVRAAQESAHRIVELVGSAPTGGGRRIRQRTVDARISYRRWHEQLARLAEPILTHLVADLGDAVEQLAALLTLTNERTLTMPALVTAPQVAALAQQIRDAVTAGTGGRLAVGNSEQAFAWSGLPRTLVAQLTPAITDARHLTTVTAKESATPAAPVPEGGAKPNVVDFTSTGADLVKYAGTAKMSTESAQFVRNIESATTTVLVGSILRAVEADATEEIQAAAGVVIDAAADISAGVLEAIAGIAVNGGTANVVGLSPTDWVEVMGANNSGSWLNFDPANGPMGTWLGLVPVIVPDLAAGSAVVADGAGVTVWEVAGGPLCIVDPYTEAANNKINIVMEDWCLPDVTAPGVVAKVTVTATP